MKLPKHILSILLAVLLICCADQAAFADNGYALADDACSQAARTGYPTIYLAGGWHALYDSETGAAYFDTSDSMLTDASTKDMILAAAQNLDFDALGDALVRMYTKAYEDVAMDCDGESINPNLKCAVALFLPTGTLDGLPAAEALYPGYIQSLGLDPALLKQFPDGTRYYGADVALYFKDNEGYYSFDWRIDPVENARILHEWIENTVLPKSGKDKVNLAFVSGSGPIGLAYLSEYMEGLEDHVNAITFNEAFHNGSSMWGGIATRQFRLDPDALGNTGPMYEWGFQEIIKPYIPMIRLLYEAGLIDVLAKFFNRAASGAFDRLYEEALIPMWFHMPFYWALVPANVYEQAKRALFPTHSEYTAHAKLFEMTDRYHKIQAGSDSLFAAAADKIKVGINCSYGYPLNPYSAMSYVSSDELVDTYYASCGATCALPNRPFSIFYKQAKAVEGGKPGYSYVSPDRMVDASTGVLSDHTWFNKDAPHLPDLRMDGWVEWFCNAPKGEDTVHDNARYPQWMTIIEYGYYKPLEFTDTLWNRLVDTLLMVMMWVANIWRQILLLPLFWM